MDRSRRRACRDGRPAGHTVGVGRKETGMLYFIIEPNGSVTVRTADHGDIEACLKIEMPVQHPGAPIPHVSPVPAPPPPGEYGSTVRCKQLSKGLRRPRCSRRLPRSQVKLAKLGTEGRSADAMINQP